MVALLWFPVRHRVWLLGCLALVACGPASPADAAPTPAPPVIRLYTQNGTGLGEGEGEGDIGWRITAPGQAPMEGFVTRIPEWSCVRVTPGWTLTIVDLTAAGGPRVISSRTDTDPPGEGVIDLAVDVDADRDPITRGVPSWWGAKPQHCDVVD